MNVHFNQPSRASWVSALAPTVGFSRAEGPLSPQASTLINISPAARRLNTAATEVGATSDLDPKTIELKNYINSLDFRSVSPTQMNQLASKLVSSGQLNANQVSAFMGIENDTVQPGSATDQIDVLAHFNMMYAVVSEAAKSDSTLNFGVQWRQASIDMLSAIRSFASSSRSHIVE